MRAVAGPTLTAFELMSRDSLNPVAPMLGLKQFPFEPLTPWTVLLEISDHEDESHARSLLEAGLDPASGAPVIDAVLSRSLAESERLWRLREAIPESQAQSGGNVKHDISLPLSRVSDFVQETGERLAREFDWAHPVVFGHLGDGNLHYNVGCRAGVSPQVAFEHEQALNEIVYEAVYECGGSISAEHGSGSLSAVQHAATSRRGTGADACDQVRTRPGRTDEPGQTALSPNPTRLHWVVCLT